ncbi:hypothetical protein [Desulfovibrio falkowii]|uniref:hypothetical protein n=1 Tax=Desulfovibrio falkowii TaxID=3136602 RepID=UPI0038B36EB3
MPESCALVAYTIVFSANGYGAGALPFTGTVTFKARGIILIFACTGTGRAHSIVIIIFLISHRNPPFTLDGSPETGADFSTAHSRNRTSGSFTLTLLWPDMSKAIDPKPQHCAKRFFLVATEQKPHGSRGLPCNKA